MRVGDVEVGIDAKCDGEEILAVRAIAVEEIAVVEIAVGPRERDRLGRLVDRVIVALGQHRALPNALMVPARGIEPLTP